MRRVVSELSDMTFDVVIVGGGISGACCAHDAALRGLSVALVERDDFGGATSSASSKLLHGGIRYLQQARPGKVRESARERAFFQRIAPHLTHWVPFLIPTQTGLLRGGGFCNVECGRISGSPAAKTVASPTRRSGCRTAGSTVVRGSNASCRRSARATT